MKIYRLFILVCCVVFLFSCTAPKIKFFPSRTDPLQEFAVSGEAREKILVINVRGFISDKPKTGLLGGKPSIVEEAVAQLRKAEQDHKVKAVLLKIDSPGGTVTASDVLYNEVHQFKARTGKKLVAAGARFERDKLADTEQDFKTLATAALEAAG